MCVLIYILIPAADSMGWSPRVSSLGPADAARPCRCTRPCPSARPTHLLHRPLVARALACVLPTPSAYRVQHRPHDAASPSPACHARPCALDDTPAAPCSLPATADDARAHGIPLLPSSTTTNTSTPTTAARGPLSSSHYCHTSSSQEGESGRGW